MESSLLPGRVTFIAILFVVCANTGCEKNKTSKDVDPGYGCSTSIALQSVTNVSAQLKYMTPAIGAKWYIVVQVPGASGTVSVICDYCDHNTEIQALLAGHTTAETINVTLSGKIKRSYENELIWNPDGSYPGFYKISLDAIH